MADELHALRAIKSAILNISSSLTRFSAHVLYYLKKTRHKILDFTDFCCLRFQSILRRSNPIEQLWRNIWFSSVYTLLKLHPTSFIFENLWGVLEIHLGWTPIRKRQECKETNRSGSVVQSLFDSQSPCLNTARWNFVFTCSKTLRVKWWFYFRFAFCLTLPQVKSSQVNFYLNSHRIIINTN